MKAGLLDKKYAKRFSTISAWAELIGYFGNVTLNALRIAAALERELMLTQELVRRKKVCMHASTYILSWHRLFLCLKSSLSAIACEYQKVCIARACNGQPAKLDISDSSFACTHAKKVQQMSKYKQANAFA